MSDGGGLWNGPFNVETGRFVYVPIPETKPVNVGYERPYSLLVEPLRELGVTLPSQLLHRQMHLDPDFEKLTYGDRGQRGIQLSRKLRMADVVVFYAGLRCNRGTGLRYVLIGVIKVREIVPAVELVRRDPDANAHTRRTLANTADDIVVIGEPTESGRFDRALDIGEYRSRAYRVRPDILAAWGGISSRDGYLQRSARLPEANDGDKLLGWIAAQGPRLLKRNN